MFKSNHTNIVTDTVEHHGYTTLLTVKHEEVNDLVW